MYEDTKSPNIIQATRTSDQLIEMYKDYKTNFILEPIIFQNGINILGAERGTGKTRTTIALAYAIITEQGSFLGYPVNLYGNVLFLNFEMHEPEFKLMVGPIEKFIKGGHECKHIFHSLSFKSHPYLTIDDIGKAINQFKPVLVIVDSYKAFSSRFMTEKKITTLDNSNMDSLYKIFSQWKEQCSTTVLITNHTNKGTHNSKSHSDLMYGASALMDYADQTALIRKAKEPNQRIIIPDKSRFASEEKSVSNLYEIRSNDDGTELWLDLIEYDVLEGDYINQEQAPTRSTAEQRARADELKQQGMSLTDIAAELLGDPKKKGTISKWLKKARLGV